MVGKVFVGNLSSEVTPRDLEDAFGRFGKIINARIKNPDRPPSFGFVDFEDERDAEDAVRDMDGEEIKGRRIRVEFCHERKPRDAYSSSRRDYDDRRGDHRIPTGPTLLVENLDSSVSWQDLKDFMREAGGTVLRTTVDRRGMGSAVFGNYDDLKMTMEKLDDTELKGSRVKLSEDRGRSRSRSRSPRRRSYSRSPRRRSYSRSPRRRSYSRSPRRRSYSRSPRRRSYSRSPRRRSYSRSPRRRHRRARKRSYSRSPSRSKSAARSRSASPRKDGAEEIKN